MKYYQATTRCPACDAKFLYAITEEEIEEIDILEAMCPQCGEMAELENLVPCDEMTYEGILEAYEDSLDEEDEFNLLDLKDDLDDDLEI